MESKHLLDSILCSICRTFNRTSMESKLDRNSASVLSSLPLWLLIEPVWNRNFTKLYYRFCDAILLIEPVWNRNNPGSIAENFLNDLLIEPVWNRNSYVMEYNDTNTYLLIEPVWNRNSVDCHCWACISRGLLIEPVWNRNMFFSTTLFRQVSTFNRTSMESKPDPLSYCSWIRLSFNRTSMESKRSLSIASSSFSKTF